MDAHLKNKWTLTWIKLENSLRLSCSPLQQLLASQRGSEVANKAGPLHSNPIIPLFSGASARGGLIFKSGSNFFFYSRRYSSYLEKSLAFVLCIDENRQSVSDQHRLLAYCKTIEKKNPCSCPAHLLSQHYFIALIIPELFTWCTSGKKFTWCTSTVMQPSRGFQPFQAGVTQLQRHSKTIKKGIDNRWDLTLLPPKHMHTLWLFLDSIPHVAFGCQVLTKCRWVRHRKYSQDKYALFLVFEHI